MSKVLIVVDMQNDFIDGVLANEAAKAIVPKVAKEIERCRKLGWRIVTTRDEHDADYESTKEFTAGIPPHCLKWTEGFELNPQIKDVIDPEEDYCICKPTLGSIDLINVLYDIEDEFGIIEEIEVIGLCTDMCVMANAVIVASAFPNAHVHVESELCAGSTEEAHDNALAAMKQMLICVDWYI